MGMGARRGPLAAHLQTEPETSSTRHSESTPRPSISPLSAKASPARIEGGVMQSLEIHARADLQDDDSRSSSLSEPEDDEDEELRPHDAKLLDSTTLRQVTQQSLEVESEAETERLERTPEKLVKHTLVTGRTPSKLSYAATADDDLSDPPSPMPAAGPGAVSSTSIAETLGKKRKRSNTADSSLTSADSDVGSSPRKRNSSPAKEIIGLASTVAADEAVTDSHDANKSPAAAEADNRDPAIGTKETVVPSTAKGGRGRKPGKQKGRHKKDAQKGVEQEKEEVAEPGPGEPSGETIAKSSEDLKHKQTASAMFEDLAKQFSAFREKMYTERIAALNAELDLLNQPDCKHPEYLRQTACVDARYQKQVNESQALYRFKFESLRQTTLGERSQLHSQYYQHAREIRESYMGKLGEDWYNVQKERRQSSQGKDEAYIYKFQAKKSAQIKQQAKYNQEVSILSGVAKYVGFPAAPKILGAVGENLEDDLEAMKFAKRVQQRSTLQQPVYIPNRSALLQGQSDRIAHEQFIEQNPWARPQGQFHNHGTPNLTHTPDWAAEPGAHGSKKHIRPEGVGGVGSPYTTPMSQSRPTAEFSSSATVVINSDGAEQGSSVIATPPTIDRVQQGHTRREQGSPLEFAKHRQNRELAGFRNITNLSNASTLDAPSNVSEKERDVHGVEKGPHGPQPIFDPGRLTRNVNEAKRRPEVYAGALFRPQGGLYGTPAPLPASNAAQ